MIVDKRKQAKKNKGLGFKNLVYTLVFIVGLFFLILTKMETQKIHIKVGDQASDEIRANKDIIDKKATRDLVENIKKNNEKIYTKNPSVQTTMKRTLSDFFYNVKKAKGLEDKNIDEKIEYISSNSRVILSKEEYKTALYLSDKELDEFRLTVDDIISQIMVNGITEGSLEKEKENVKKSFESLEIDEAQKKLGTSLVNEILQPNKFYDKEETQKRLEEKLDSVQPVMIKEQQVIVKKGETVTKEQYEIIKELGLLKDVEQSEFKIIVGIILLVILWSSMLVFYLDLFNKEVFTSNKYLILLLITLGMIVLSNIVYKASPYLMPIAGATLLIAILIDTRLAIFINTMLVFILAFILNLEFSVIAMYLISGSLGTYMIKNNQERQEILLNSLFISIFNIIVILAFSLMKKLEFIDVLYMLGYGFLNGIISGVITIGTLPIWENLFKVITPLKLLELSNPNQPLLKRLLLEAPGTYHHSIVVGSLSERAAEEVGADSLLARTSAYYHDIGKLKHPFMFKENQIGMSNPHDRLEPAKSAEIIINHVAEGIKLAKENNLPKEIIEIMSQHHGDTQVMYFYYKAKEENPDVDIRDFTYPGPKPQTKEAAIVMLADSSEAAVRSIQNPTKEDIEKMVDNVFRGKLESDQFAESDINFKDLSLIRDTFISTFLGMYHERIEYPKVEEKKDEE